MADLVAAASLAVAAVAVLSGLLTLLRTGRARSALVVALDFLAAAGLLRLSAGQTWAALAGAAAVIAIRHLLAWAFTAPSRPPAEAHARPGRRR